MIPFLSLGVLSIAISWLHRAQVLSLLICIYIVFLSIYVSCLCMYYFCWCCYWLLLLIFFSCLCIATPTPSSVLASPPPHYFRVIYMSTSFIGSKTLHIVIDYLVLWLILLSSSLVLFKKDHEYITQETVNVFILFFFFFILLRHFVIFFNFGLLDTVCFK